MHTIQERYLRPDRVQGWVPNMHKPTGTTGFWNALSYFVKSYVGPGCLALPLGLQRTGIGLGTAILLLCLFIATYNQYSMLLCQRSIKHLGICDYKSLAKYSLGQVGESLVEALVNTLQLGVCSIYFSFIAENLHALLSAHESVFTTRTACFFYIAPVFGSSALLPNVEAMAPFTKLANALVFTPIIIVICYAFLALNRDGVGDGVNIAVFDGATPLYFGTAIFCFSGITNLFPVENSLAHPDEMFSLLWFGMTIVGTIFLTISISSHLAWPAVTNGSITAELAETIGGVLIDSAGLMVIVSVALTFPVQLFPAVELWESRVGLQVSKPSPKIVQTKGTEEVIKGFKNRPQQPVAGNIPYIGVVDDEEGFEDDGIGQEEGLLSSSSTFQKAEVSTYGQTLGLGTNIGIAEEGGIGEGRGAESNGESADETLNRIKLEKRLKYGVDSNNEEGQDDIKRIILRLSLVACCGLVAYAVKDLEQLLGVIGSMGGSLITLVLPALIDLKMRPSKYRSHLVTVLDISFVIIGFIMGAWGSYTSLEYGKLK